MPGILSEGSTRGSAPMYGARRGIRCRLPEAWDREPVRASRQRWFGRADRKAAACSAGQEQKAHAAA